MVAVMAMEAPYYCRAIVITRLSTKEDSEVKSSNNQARVDERKCSFDFGSLAIGFLANERTSSRNQTIHKRHFQRLLYFLIRYGNYQR
jgi:hypothetical protein